MLDDNDIKKLIEAQKEVFVTKEEFEGLIDIVATKEQVEGLDKRLGGIEKTLKVMDEKLDKVEVIEKRVDYIENTLSIATKSN